MLLSIRNLSVRYDRTFVLQNMNLDVAEGEFVAIVGKSGCGKTTLLNAIAGLIPFEGEIRKPETIGMVFQKNAVFPWMTVAENISFAIKNQEKSELEGEQSVVDYVKLAQLEDKKDRYPAELSGGQVQRVAFARTLAHNPDLILMDEPFGALDAYTREQMQSWLLDVWSTHKKTIIFVTHDIEEAVFLADRMLVLKNGTFASEFSVPCVRPRSNQIKFSHEFITIKKQAREALS